MSPRVDQLEATEALSKLLRSFKIDHAIIGGFAVSLLGHRRDTEDVDVVIDLPASMTGQLKQELSKHDDRFAVQHHRLSFKPTDSNDRVLIDSLPLGELGLPRELRIFTVENCGIPILHPAVLILTKMKRCVHFINSTRPKSIIKFRNDLADITFLLNWLAERGEKIDFVRYNSPTVDRLYTAVADIAAYWRQAHEDDLVDLLGSVLEPSDCEKIVNR
ncbi:hypothetical protein F5Y06DRAFT_291803 [Hypoxylon sp. FL0890]|nr:hypothetical protein F5Y06DRAFT_291803 [Hypoxylon sp. FL0890]